MTLTKQDIDALVDGMPHRPESKEEVYLDFLDDCAFWVPKNAFRRAMYVAAGLTAEGERKPERVRCWMALDGRGVPSYVRLDRPHPMEGYVQGVFVPDGAE